MNFFQCCAHEFKFTIPVLNNWKYFTRYNWFENDFNADYTAKALCKDERRNKTIEGKDCTIKFFTHDMYHPRGLTDQIDLMQLLVNTTHYLRTRSHQEKISLVPLQLVRFKYFRTQDKNEDGEKLTMVEF